MGNVKNGLTLNNSNKNKNRNLIRRKDLKIKNMKRNEI